MEQRSRPPAAKLIETLRSAGCVYAEDEAAILAEAAGSPAQLVRMVEQRVGGIPLEHIVGWAEFDGVRVTVAPGVFVPRQRSVFLVEQALTALAGQAVQRPVILDLCCGCGALGAALARRLAGSAPSAPSATPATFPPAMSALPPCELYAVDVDAAAVACATGNVAPFGGQVLCGNLFHPLPHSLHGSLDLILANAPYVPRGELEFMPREARLYEPASALAGGADGLELHRSIAAQAGLWLRPGGTLLLECSAQQAAVSAEILAGSGFSTRSARSEELDCTVVTGILASSSGQTSL